MSTGRNRANRSLGSKLNSIEQKAEQAATAPKALPKDSVTEHSLAPDSVTSSQIAPGSVDQDAMANGAVQTQHLGIINSISSNSELLLASETGIAVAGSGYVLPTDNRQYTLSLSSTGKLLANKNTTAPVVYAIVSRYYTSGPVPFYFLDSDGRYSGIDMEPDGWASWVKQYTPTPGELVILGRDTSSTLSQGIATSEFKTNGGWVILGSVAESFPSGAPRTYDIPLADGVSDTVRYSDNYAAKSMTRTKAGIVSLSGLVYVPVEGVDPGGAIYKLPYNFRPDVRMDFPMRVAPTAVLGVTTESNTRISIYPDGRVVLPQGGVSGPSSTNSWISLDNIQYPAAGVANWVPLGTTSGIGDTWKLTSNFVDAGDIDTGPIATWTDNYGYTWFRGQVSPVPGYSPGNNATILSWTNTSNNIPTVSGRQVFVSCCTDNTMGAISSNARAIEWQAPSTGSSSIATSLSSVVLAPSTGTAPTFQNSWVNYGSPYATVSFYSRSDSMAYLRGTAKSGTIRASAFTSTSGFTTLPIPSGRMVRAAVSANADARLDILVDGRYVPNAGSTAAFSFDGQMIIPPYGS